MVAIQQWQVNGYGNSMVAFNGIDGYCSQITITSMGANAGHLDLRCGGSNFVMNIFDKVGEQANCLLGQKITLSQYLWKGNNDQQITGTLEYFDCRPPSTTTTTTTTTTKKPNPPVDPFTPDSYPYQAMLTAQKPTLDIMDEDEKPLYVKLLEMASKEDRVAVSCINPKFPDIVKSLSDMTEVGDKRYCNMEEFMHLEYKPSGQLGNKFSRVIINQGKPNYDQSSDESNKKEVTVGLATVGFVAVVVVVAMAAGLR